MLENPKGKGQGGLHQMPYATADCHRRSQVLVGDRLLAVARSQPSSRKVMRVRAPSAILVAGVAEASWHVPRCYDRYKTGWVSGSPVGDKSTYVWGWADRPDVVRRSPAHLDLWTAHRHMVPQGTPASTIHEQNLETVCVRCSSANKCSDSSFVCLG